MSLPNKTIYIKDSDLPVWDRAQQDLGESISSVFAEYLRERLETEATRKKAKKVGRVDEVQAMNALLVEINAALNLGIEPHSTLELPNSGRRHNSTTATSYIKNAPIQTVL